MAYASSNKEADNRYEFRSDNYPTVSKLARPSNASYTVDRQNIDNPYSTRKPNDDRSVTTSHGIRDNVYESVKQNNDNRYTVHRISNAHENNTHNTHLAYTRRVPTADVYVDPIRRPSDGNARTCCMEINIAVSLGPDRKPQATIVPGNFDTKPSNIRSRATFEDVRYVDLNFQSPENTAQLTTDGVMRRLPSTKDHTN